MYLYHEQWIFGLEVTGRCPVFVGCSFRTPGGNIIDHPGEWLESEGLALFETELSFSDTAAFRAERNISFSHPQDAAGDDAVLCKGWRDNTFTTRLACKIKSCFFFGNFLTS